MTMTNDPTTTPAGEADMPQTGKTGRGRSASRASYPGMMGGGAEEQNVNQGGDPSARIGEGEVDQVSEPRSFMDKEARAETLAALTDKVNAVRDQVQSSAEAARDWARRQADSAADSAKRLHAERPVLVLSVSAGAALAVGLLAGFVIGRATADDY
jgi:ElaB/YqjD/DUF883 family membrane-anchored ribosome-binding protein